MSDKRREGGLLAQLPTAVLGFLIILLAALLVLGEYRDAEAVFHTAQ
jgi:hypothetical protein